MSTQKDLKHFIHQDLTEELKVAIKLQAAPDNVYFLEAGSAVTMDYRTDRVRVWYVNLPTGGKRVSGVTYG